MALRTARLLLLSTAVVISTGAGARISQDLSAQIRAIANNGDYVDEGRAWLEGRLSGRASLRTNRLSADIAGSGAHREPVSGSLRSNTVVQGQADALGELVEDALFVRAGATAQRRDGSLYGGFGGIGDLDGSDSVQVYSLFVEPRLRRQVGSDLLVDLSYNAGQTFTDGSENTADLFGGRGRSDSFTQRAQASFTYRPGGRISLGTEANWSQEDFDRFDQRYRSYRFGGFAGYQLSTTAALRLNAGYEDIENSQARVLFDPATGLPLRNEDGDYIVSPDMRRSLYSRDGIYATAGLTVQLSRRLEGQLTAGWQDQGEYFSGQFSYRPGNYLTFSGSANRSISSLARNLTQSRSLFGVVANPRDLPIDGEDGGADGEEVPALPTLDPNCPLGFDPQLGECIYDDPLGAVAGTYRQTRVQLSANWARNRVRLGTSAYYSERSRLGSDEVDGIDLFGNRDNTTYGVAAQAGLQLPDRQSINAGATVSRSDGAGTFGETNRISVQANYRKGFAQNIFVSMATTAAYRTGQSDVGRDGGSYSASIGIGYTF